MSSTPSANAQPYKWIVGLDLGARSQGAIAFAQWLAEHGGDRSVGVHVLEEAALHTALRYHHLSELERMAKQAADDAIARVGATAAFDSVHVVEGKTAEQSLEQVCEEQGGDAFLVGRNAPREGVHALRLGRVARRLLRNLPAPVLVVPPDVDATHIGAGPVLVACSACDDVLDACQFAKAFAARFARPLELVYVASMPDHHSAQYLPESTLAKMRDDHIAVGRAELSAWAAANGFGDAIQTVVLGTVRDQLAALAEERAALCIVTGSRRLSMVERWLLVSSGSELAAHATCPVVVVAPRHPA